MILYVTENRHYVVTTGMQGTYDVVKIIPKAGERAWETTRYNRDHFGQAREIADRLDSEAMA